MPQLGDGAQTRSGHYTQEDARRIVAHAASLHIQVVPEIDIPAHSMATLFSLPELVDGQEAPDSYRSVQGYPNNALNPAVEFTYEFLGKVFDEMVTLFPGEYLHIGGDEVAQGSWLSSPLCKALMAREKLAGTAELQSYFLKRIKAMLSERGRKLAGWNEVSHGGGVDRDGTLLMAWEKPAVGIELAQQGYDVVMTPGQAYYLDMAQAEAWAEPGAAWAGYAPPEHTYAYEAEGELPEALQEKMRGIQACIWTENFVSRAYFNRLVFPRPRRSPRLPGRLLCVRTGTASPRSCGCGRCFKETQLRTENRFALFVELLQAISAFSPSSAAPIRPGSMRHSLRTTSGRSNLRRIRARTAWSSSASSGSTLESPPPTGTMVAPVMLIVSAKGEATRST